MIIVIISWLYIVCLCILSGLLVRKGFSRILPLTEAYGISEIIAYGFCAMVVYAGYYSVLFPVDLLCHLILLSICIISAFLNRKELKDLSERIRLFMHSHEFLFFLLVVIIIAFFSSRGEANHDTKLYHAQMIRLTEEYGVFKGMGNLQINLNYNSAYYPFCALFTFRWLLGEGHALHTTDGFIFLWMSVYAFHGLFRIRFHVRHAGDATRIAILIYALSNLRYAMSPASDYVINFLVLYLICSWCDAVDDRAPVMRYAMLAVFSMLLVSIKLAAAAVVIVAFYPAGRLLMERKIRSILLLLLSGFLVFLPYLIRNYYVSGWMFYPVSAIDVYDVEWKVPRELLEIDANMITARGRHRATDLSALEQPMRVWVPAWWEDQAHYDQRLMYAEVTALLLAAFLVFKKKKAGLHFRPAMLVLYGMVALSILLWFVMAPFIRYSQSFLLVAPLLVLADWFDTVTAPALRKHPPFFSGIPAVLILMFFCAFLDNYTMDVLVFAKHEYRAPYYFMQKPFDDAEVAPLELTSADGTVYTFYSTTDPAVGINSYYHTPASLYPHMLSRIELIGNSLKDGIRYRGNTD